jgi:competence protein ComEC
MPGWSVGLYCFEVGQASCAALIDPIPRRSPRSFQATVIDAGGTGVQLAQRLTALGVQRIVAIALTHNDSDHIRGLAALVQAYRERVGDVWLLTDRGTAPRSIWMPVRQWRERGWIQRIHRLEAPVEPPPGVGENLLQEQEASYRLYCIYPSMFDVESVLRGAERLGEPLGRGPNAVSAVLRLTPPDSPTPTRVLFGGDLDYPGWRHLHHLRYDLQAPAFVVPHHGGPSGAQDEFGAPQLAEAVRPRFALISAGSTNEYGHPHASLIQNLRRVGAAVLCTQITPRCVNDPGSVRGGAILPRAPATPRVGRSGTACAGTVVVVIRDSGVSLQRIAEHQAAVNQLQSDGHHPLCRP